RSQGRGGRKATEGKRGRQTGGPGDGKRPTRGGPGVVRRPRAAWAGRTHPRTANPQTEGANSPAGPPRTVSARGSQLGGRPSWRGGRLISSKRMTESSSLSLAGGGPTGL